MRYSIVLFVLLFGVLGCKNQEKPQKKGPLKIVTTTSQVTDLLLQLGGDKIELEGLMGPGVDPHLYKASEGDVTKLYNADAIFYNGLHLEGKIEDVLKSMKKQGKKTVAVADALSPELLIASEDFASNYDPHFWFRLLNWKKVARFVTHQLAALDPKNAKEYQKNLEHYLQQLKDLEAQLHETVAILPIEERILVTAHDAFAYLGKNFNFKVVPLQGLSTATEAGVQDVRRLANFIITHKVKAIFVESSVPVRTIQALQESVQAQGAEVSIGGTLFSDALGNPNTLEGTYIGMYKYNITTIVTALKTK